MHIVLHTDGGARGNPGPSAIGVVLANTQGKTLKEISQTIGVATNNQAEYEALLAGLVEAEKLGASLVDIYMDSELIVKQVKGIYKVKNADLAVLFARVWNALQNIGEYRIHHIPREKNKRADALVNEALDSGYARNFTI